MLLMSSKRRISAYFRAIVPDTCSLMPTMQIQAMMCTCREAKMVKFLVSVQALCLISLIFTSGENSGASEPIRTCSELSPFWSDRIREDLRDLSRFNEIRLRLQGLTIPPLHLDPSTYIAFTVWEGIYPVKNKFGSGKHLKLFGGIFETRVSVSIIAQGLLTENCPQVEQNGRFLIVYARLLQGSGRSKSIVPLKGNVDMVALPADWKPCLHHAQTTIIPALHPHKPGSQFTFLHRLKY